MQESISKGDSFLNAILHVLSSALTEAYNHAILVCISKCHPQLSKADLILNLPSQQASLGSSEIFCVFSINLEHCAVLLSLKLH
jgi:hypothetical protein